MNDWEYSVTILFHVYYRLDIDTDYRFNIQFWLQSYLILQNFDIATNPWKRTLQMSWVRLEKSINLEAKKKKKIAKNIERDTRVECLAKIPAFVSFNDDKKLLEDAMLFALQHKQLTENEIKTTKHFRKSFLCDKKESWKNVDSCFDVTMGGYDGAETCKLVGTYI